MEPLAKADLLDRGFVELIDQMGDDNSVVAAARVSYLGESKGPEKDRKLIRFMMKHRHTSPFEHVVFTWRIKCPLFVRSQWHRHRTWSYNEVSRRYTSEDIDFYHPEGQWRVQDQKNPQSSGGYLVQNGADVADSRLYAVIGYALDTYDQLLTLGVAREQARMVLPQNLYTTFYGTVDLHNLLHFFGLRSSGEAQYEIRVYSQAMERIIAERVPWSYEAWKEFVG